ncbi:hypothetical protein [Erythrobacter aureus]|nr:hypothetical protein [Erythrobacter aureus]
MSDPKVLAQALSPAKRRNLLALAPTPGAWMTIAEMKNKGATGSGMNLLYAAGFRGNRLVDGRFVKWGGEPGQKRGEGYEYTLTALGREVRDLLEEWQKA